MASYLSLYSQDRPELRRGHGVERRCSCPSPAHEDQRPSCSVNVATGKWYCHGCSKGGHVVEWLRWTRGLSQAEALQESRHLGLTAWPERGFHSRRNGHRRSRQLSSIEKAPPVHLPTPYEACFRYRTPAGDEYARVYRYPANRPDRKADPYTLRAVGPHGGTWTNRAPNERWPYRVETLSAEAPVVIVEGEKCADALAGLAEETDGLSWMGGCNAVMRTRWNGLSGREVSLWPDADRTGRECMVKLAERLARIGAAAVRSIDPERARAPGWDVADAIAMDGWGWDEVEHYLGQAKVIHEDEKRRLRRVARTVLVRADEIKSRPVESIWEPYLPSGALTLRAGAPGCGKSFLSTALAASLSRGLTPFFGRGTERIKTAILSLEDDSARTIVPRLAACGADLKEIVIFDPHHPEAESLGRLSIAAGRQGELLRVLKAGVETHGYKLVVIDTLTAFTPAGVDGHAANSVRQMMNPLAGFASDCGVGILVVTHTRKSDGARSTHGVQATILGSVDYVAASRSILVVQKDPKSEEKTAGVMTHAKSNFGPLGRSLSFSIGAGGWQWREERTETAEEIEAANIARREQVRRKDRKGRRQARTEVARDRIKEGIRACLEAHQGEEISTRELRENVEGKNDTIASVLKELAGQGCLQRHEKGKQKVLWSLIGGEVSGSSGSAEEPRKPVPVSQTKREPVQSQSIQVDRP